MDEEARHLEGEPADTSFPGTVYRGMVVASRVCIRCGYALQGLRVADRCPECGTAVTQSLRDARLADAAPDYLATLHSGLALLVFGMLALVLGGVLLLIMFVYGAMSQLDVAVVLVTTRLFMSFVIWPLLYVGAWRLAAPNPGEIARETTYTARRVVRATVVVQASVDVLLLLRWAMVVASGPTAPLRAMGLFLAAVTAVNLIVHSGVMMQYIRTLSTRVPDHRLFRLTSLNVALLPVAAAAGVPLSIAGFFVVPCCGSALLLVPVMAVILYWAALDRLRAHIRAMRRGEPRASLGGLDRPPT